MHVTTDRETSATPPSSALRNVANALRRSRHAAAQCLTDSIAGWEKFAPAVESMGVQAFTAWETIPLVDYLVHYLHGEDPSWRNLFIGERLKQLDWRADTLEQLVERRRRVFTADRDALLELLRPQVAADELNQTALCLDQMRERVTTAVQSSREVKILLVGDCLFLDVTTFLAAPLLDRGLTLRPVYATSKNPIELRSTLRGLAGENFDLVCYSPYSYEFNLTLTQTHYLKGMLSSPRSLRKLAGDAHRQMAPTLRLLCDQFECNVVLHNSANIRRHSGTLASYAKCAATAAARKLAAKEVNALLEVEVAERNAASVKPLLLIDEFQLSRRHGALSLGKKFYDSEAQHPTVMALRLSEIYCDIIGAAKHLSGKKLVVVDLDNTIWSGVIGEGSVKHDHGRQKILKRLRQKGVLLAIASKNDPQNVHWTGAVLGESDFVCAQINWDPKSITIRRIAEELNLKPKDFVFIDDRPDEREMVRMAIPGIHCLDATSDSTWRMLEWWSEALPEQNEADRTQMYIERKLRQTYLQAAAEKEDHEQLLPSLGLRIAVRRGKPKELARAAELINRTNQFNTCGSRVSHQQLASWNESEHHHILVAEASDKFGGMGIISVMVLEQIEEALQIPVWVLSCRVFGFGMETAMLNQARRLGERLGVSIMRGLVIETPNNQPCRNVYSVNGFSWTEAGWEAKVSGTLSDPAWLSVEAAHA